MRILSIVLPLVVVAGCAAVSPPDEEAASAENELESKKESVAWGPCLASRATILKSVSTARAGALERGFAWLDADVPFNMKATYGTYRTDCSGFVSMVWSLKAPGLTTETLGTAKSGSSKLGSYDDLVPADALVDTGAHSVIFLGWNDASQKGACVLEQSSKRNDMQFRVRMTADLKKAGFVPVRADKFKNDTKVVVPSEDPSPSPTSPEKPPADPSTDGKKDSDDPPPPVKPPAPPPVPSTPPASPASPSTPPTTPSAPPPPTTPPVTPPVCTSKPVATVCAEAMAKGVECGRVIDNCGRVVDCSGLAGFGCSEYEACYDAQCTSTCTPKSIGDLCYSAKLSSGIECGKIPDGCGGTVDCDTLPYFGCDDGETCGGTTANRCPAKAGETNEPSPSKPGAPSGTSKPNASDEEPLASGDSGDSEDESAKSSTRTTNEVEETLEKKKRPAAASSGCSTSPGTRMHDTGSVLVPALAALLLLGARRRRSEES